MPRARTWKGLEVRTVATIAGCFCLVLYFQFAEVLPQMEDLVDARDAICSGDRDFVIAKDGFGVPVWAYPARARRPRGRSGHFFL